MLINARVLVVYVKDGLHVSINV